MYKPVGKYQFTVACIRAVVMIMYQVINCLISLPNYMLRVLIRTVAMRRFLLDYRLDRMSKKKKLYLSRVCCKQNAGMIHLSEQVKLIEFET